MVKPLTSKSRILGEQRRISQLTNEHSAYFKVIFSHQIHRKFMFGSLYRGGLSNKDLLKVYKSFGIFLDESIRMTITEVEETYGRKPYRTDRTFDPELNIEVPVQHLCLYKKGTKKHTQCADSVRIHGYFRVAGGYFVINRLDWFHKSS